MNLLNKLSRFERTYFDTIKKKREKGKIVSAFVLLDAIKVLKNNLDCDDYKEYLQIIMEEYYKNKEKGQKSFLGDDPFLSSFEAELIKFEKLKAKNEKRILREEKEAIKEIKEQFANFIKSGTDALAKREKERNKLVNDILTFIYN